MSLFMNRATRVEKSVREHHRSGPDALAVFAELHPAAPYNPSAAYQLRN